MDLKRLAEAALKSRQGEIAGWPVLIVPKNTACVNGTIMDLAFSPQDSQVYGTREAQKMGTKSREPRRHREDQEVQKMGTNRVSDQNG